MKWYNKPITWKGYGILVLISYVVMVIYAIVSILVLAPDWLDEFFTPFRKAKNWLYKKARKAMWGI